MRPIRYRLIRHMPVRCTGYEVYDHAHKVYAHETYAYEVIAEESEMKSAIKDEPLKELEDIIGRNVTVGRRQRRG